MPYNDLNTNDLGGKTMPYQRSPDEPLFVLCGSCGYLTIEPAPPHCKQAQDHHPEPVFLDTRAVEDLWNALARHLFDHNLGDGLADDGLADEGLGRNFDGGA